MTSYGGSNCHTARAAAAAVVVVGEIFRISLLLKICQTKRPGIGLCSGQREEAIVI
jgi:hypothetical protein